eukprot:1208874-Rhodomonas_salina.2
MVVQSQRTRPVIAPRSLRTRDASALPACELGSTRERKVPTLRTDAVVLGFRARLKRIGACIVARPTLVDISRALVGVEGVARALAAATWPDPVFVFPR